MAFKSAILHAGAKQQMTNDSAVAEFQFIVAGEWRERTKGERQLVNGKIGFVITFVWKEI